MYKHLSTIFLLILFAQIGCAQEIIRSEQTFRFVFIDHEPTLDPAKIIGHLRTLKRKALENNNALVIYMPSDLTPFVVKINIDKLGETEESNDEFNRLIASLNLSSHNKDIHHDRENVIDFIMNTIDKNGQLIYQSVNIDFYLTSKFWDLGYNEKILAPIYFATNSKKLRNDLNYDMSIYYDPDDMPKYEEGGLFGTSNLDNINTDLDIYPYDF